MQYVVISTLLGLAVLLGCSGLVDYSYCCTHLTSTSSGPFIDRCYRACDSTLLSQACSVVVAIMELVMYVAVMSAVVFYLVGFGLEVLPSPVMAVPQLSASHGQAFQC